MRLYHAKISTPGSSVVAEKIFTWEEFQEQMGDDLIPEVVYLGAREVLREIGESVTMASVSGVWKIELVEYEGEHGDYYAIKEGRE